MKKVMMRILSILLCVALLVPPVTPRADASFAAVISLLNSAVSYYGLFQALVGIHSDAADFVSSLDTAVHPADIEGVEWVTGTSWLRSEKSMALLDSNESLHMLCQDFNERYDFEGGSLQVVKTTNPTTGVSYYAIRVIASSGTGGVPYYLCDGSGEGRVLCSIVSEDDAPADDVWVLPDVKADHVRMLPYEDLYNKAVETGGKVKVYGNDEGKYFVVYDASRTYIRATADGLVYVARNDPNQWGSDQDRPATEGKDETGKDIVVEEGANVGIDIEDATITLPDGSVLEMIQNTYDESSKTYYVDARTWNDEGDTYIYNTYQYTYHINYTSITYIGQTEEYNKYYEVYYELPDGRNSADLTKEDLEQLNVSVDVIPYGRSADDTSLRSLYHFDGDTKDSSYWNYCTDFTWNKGASLTYMDAGVFDGALYLDETEHDFTITLPSAIGTGDFTLQFRYYQSHTEAPVNDSWFSVGDGDTKNACFNGAALLDGSGKHLADMPIGTWNEIALIRDNGRYCFYLNGLPLVSGNWAVVLGNQVRFHFGSQQQTFKYLDELRFLNRALVEPGVSYEPTSVPHDTNLTLVLPDSQMPVADEYWYFDTTIEPILNWDFTGYNGVPYSAFKQTGVGSLTSMPVENWSYWSGNTSLMQYDGFTSLSWNGSETVCYPGHPLPNGNTWAYYCYAGGLAVPLFDPIWRSGNNEWGYLPPHGFTQDINVAGSYKVYGKTYTLSLVDTEGEISSFTFSLPTNYVQNAYTVLASASFDWGSMQLRSGYISHEDGWNGYPLMLYIRPKTGSTLSFVYAELVEGSTPNTGHEFRSSVTILDKEDLNTPTLAVRTDLSITSHQIGGPRPSVPTKGLVWALIESDRIASLQIYNGSAWEGVDGRIWTGERWIPPSSYNIITLQDMYDIVDATQDFEYIYSESGFWAWWQRSWNDFTKMIDDRLKSILKALGGSAVSGEIEKPDEEGKSKFSLGQLVGKITSSLASVSAAALTGLIGVVSDLVGLFVESISDFASGLGDLLDVFHSFGLIAVEGEDGTGGILPQASGIAQLTKGAFAALPVDLQSMFTISFFMLIVVGIIRFFL